MTQNLFTIENQTELNSLIHRPQDNCAGDCDWCAKFHKAMKLTKAAATENNIVITLTVNAEKVGSNGHFNVWCEECSDGENNTFWECCDWAENHTKRRHNVSS
jgi:hypothetical protein